MAVFKYKILDREKSIKEGLIESINKDFAVEILQDKGFSIISIEELPSHKIGRLTILNRVKAKDLVIFSRQFAVMLSANITLVQALKILVEQTDNTRLKIIVSEIADKVDGGSKLSDALANYPRIFSNFYISVVKSGETSGKLDEVLNYLADEMEKDYDITSKIRGAMIYPVFILSGLVAVGVVMMIFVIPKLTGILLETGAELPLTTKILIGASNFLSNYWWLILIIIFGLIIGLRFYINKPGGRKNFDLIILKTPIFGKLLQLIYLVRFCRSMNTLIVGGVTIASSLKIASEVVNNKVYQQLIEETIKEVEDGNSISSVFSNSNIIPKMVSQMLSIGEKTGKIDIILEHITNFYSRRDYGGGYNIADV